ncbi:MAG: hypothetical protein DMG59_11630 [Acidobacteria bacterium]|jgi:hypothetical protein|nr:MAG: hypothetical protein DMG59_11630 [Acidobacteriota bacterium]
MTQVGEAIARYHKIIESEPYIDLAWAQALQERMKAERLGGRMISPVLRPHFLTNREYASLVKAAEALFSAINRVEQMALSSSALMARLQLLPAERMLAAVDPGYSFVSVTGLLDTNLNDGTLRFVAHNAEAPAGVIYGDTLADLFYEAAPVKEFRKKYKLKKLGGKAYLLNAMLKAYKDFGGKQKKPRIAIVEFRQPFQTAEASEHALLAEFFASEGFPTEIVSPDQLEYRSGILRRGEFAIDIAFRRIKLQEFLVRFDLSHPLVRAYKERAVCMVNSFRSELGAKRVIFDLLTDDSVTARFPAGERKAIKEFIPWTRLVQAAKTTYRNHTVDLPEFVMKHRNKLVLKPNDDSADLHSFRGAETDDSGWEKALRQAMRTPYVVQEADEPSHAVFPLLQYGSLMMKEMQVDVHPHSFLGKVHGCSSWLSVAGSNSFSTLTGLAPTFLLEGK